MPGKEINIVHFNNGSGGGVLSVIRNLIQFSENDLIFNHVIFTINKKVNDHFEAPTITGAASVKIFYYSPDWNFYYTCEQLSKLLPGDEAVVVAHDWLELGMMSNLGLQNPCVLFLHGDYDYYYDLAKKHEKAIDLFITVARSIEQKLHKVLPQRKPDTRYLRFPVPSVPLAAIKEEGTIIFIGRHEEKKGYFLLPLIAAKLKERNVDVHWHIVGNSNDPEARGTNWPSDKNVTFHGDVSNEEVLQLLLTTQIIILPSLAEGMPVVIVEAMKAGVIPIVNDIPGGIQELIIDNDTGYKIRENDINSYVKKIGEIIADKKLAKHLRHRAISVVNDLFDPLHNTMLIEEKITELSGNLRRKKPLFKAYGSRLDRSWIPNFITDKIRRD